MMMLHYLCGVSVGVVPLESQGVPAVGFESETSEQIALLFLGRFLLDVASTAPSGAGLERVLEGRNVRLVRARPGVLIAG